jgi:hypothetical protein
MKGCGIRGDDEPLRVGLVFVSRDFTASYVVKNAPAFGGSVPKDIEQDLNTYTME